MIFNWLQRCSHWTRTVTVHLSKRRKWNTEERHFLLLTIYLKKKVQKLTCIFSGDWKINTLPKLKSKVTEKRIVDGTYCSAQVKGSTEQSQKHIILPPLKNYTSLKSMSNFWFVSCTFQESVFTLCPDPHSYFNSSPKDPVFFSIQSSCYFPEQLISKKYEDKRWPMSNWLRQASMYFAEETIIKNRLLHRSVLDLEGRI